jgi:cold shock CspA family protein/ribosome-associated translation inhibitor RaiA
METPVEIDFHQFEASPAIEKLLNDRIRELESRFGRIVRGRVVVTGPGERHLSGGLFDIRIHLSLPQGREVTVSQVDHGDERHADINFAINDAFKRARRQLQDQARKLQGNTKHHEPLPTGTIDRIDPSGEYGFIITPDGQEVYFHKNSVLGVAFDRLEPGKRVTFAEERGEKGLQASTVKLMGKHSLR